MIKDIFRKILNYVFAPARNHVKNGRLARLKNNTPTIISNNCIAGIIYHDLNLQFMSPTINLWISEKDYFYFVEHFEEYINCVPVKSELNRNYPVAKISCNGRDIHLHCVHYSTFEEARDKWVERAKRVNLNNVFVFFEFPHPVCSDSEVVKQFRLIKYKNKVMLTNSRESDINDNNIYHLKSYDHHMYPGKTVHYCNYFNHKRYLDLFDYVSFLNEEMVY